MGAAASSSSAKAYIQYPTSARYYCHTDDKCTSDPVTAGATFKLATGLRNPDKDQTKGGCGPTGKQYDCDSLAAKNWFQTQCKAAGGHSYSKVFTSGIAFGGAFGGTGFCMASGFNLDKGDNKAVRLHEIPIKESLDANWGSPFATWNGNPMLGFKDNVADADLDAYMKNTMLPHERDAVARGFPKEVKSNYVNGKLQFYFAQLDAAGQVVAYAADAGADHDHGADAGADVDAGALGFDSADAGPSADAFGLEGAFAMEQAPHAHALL